jgi:hypothetical protein
MKDVSKTYEEVDYSQFDPNSGNGENSVLPKEICNVSWNWGAFFLAPIWGIYHKSWWMLLAFVVPFIVNLIAGIEGNKIAWKNRKWKDYKHFKSSQKIWGIVGLIIFLIVFIGNVIVGFLEA